MSFDGIWQCWLIRTAGFFITALAALAQNGNVSGFNPLSGGQQGIHLYDATLYSAYYSAGGPVGPDTASQGPVQAPMTAVTGSITIGGSLMGKNSSFSWSYSPSYFDEMYGGGNTPMHGSLNHRGGASWDRKIGRTGKWSISGSANMLLMDMQQLYAMPGGSAVSAETPLSGGMASPAASATLLSSEQAYLYGTRMFNASTSIALLWAPSTRTTASFTVTGNRMQSLAGGSAAGAEAAALLQKNTDARAALNLKYSLTPRTQVGFVATTDRMLSPLEQGYASSSSVSLSRMLTQHWYVEATGGAGKTVYSTHTYAVPETIQYLYGTNLGFKSFANTLGLAYDRSLGDVYGLGSASTTATSGTWTWKKPGSTWAISANGGLQKLDNLTFRNTLSWRGGASVSQRVAPHVLLTLQYSYLQFPGQLKVAGTQISDNGVIASMTWSPSTYR